MCGRLPCFVTGFSCHLHVENRNHETKREIGVSQNGGLKVHLISNMNPEYDHIISFPSISYGSTPPKINIEPENDGLEDDFPFPGVYSQVPCKSSGV